MITTIRPEHFKPIFSVVSCFVEREDGRILLLLRPQHKSEGGKWGVPAGKVDKEEPLVDALVRELYEETGIKVALSPRFFETYYVRFSDYDFIYHIFHQRVANDMKVRISPLEHTAYSWVSPEEALSMQLVTHQDDCTRFFYFSDSARSFFEV